MKVNSKYKAHIFTVQCDICSATSFAH